MKEKKSDFFSLKEQWSFLKTFLFLSLITLVYQAGIIIQALLIKFEQGYYLIPISIAWQLFWIFFITAIAVKSILARTKNVKVAVGVAVILWITAKMMIAPILILGFILRYYNYQKKA